jgi:hypothetical protein
MFTRSAEQIDHRLMLPPQVLYDGSLRLDAHYFTPIRISADASGNHRQRPHPTQLLCRCE